ncbi:MAG: hypothetical protein AAB935_00220 [Patescibacteria group bacterium]
MLFTFVSVSLIGWIITPVEVIIALGVLFKKIKGENIGYYLKLAITWTLVAIVFDYPFQLFIAGKKKEALEVVFSVVIWLIFFFGIFAILSLI